MTFVSANQNVSRYPSEMKVLDFQGVSKQIKLIDMRENGVKLIGLLKAIAFMTVAGSSVAMATAASSTDTLTEMQKKQMEKVIYDYLVNNQDL